MSWLEVSVVADGEAAEAVAEALRPFAYQNSVVLEQLGDANDLDPYALEPAVTVKIYLPKKEDRPRLRQRLEEILYNLNRLYPVPPPQFRELQETDWANAWKAHYHPFQIGERIWIQPSWVEALDAEAKQVVLTLDPGMAFGTGLHPTTQKCLRALEQLVNPGVRLLDVGTGSGILAIAAAKLGASRVLGIDIDEVAVETAVANATKNDVGDRITFRQGTLESVSEKGWDVVVVNILAPVIIDLLQNGGLMDYVAENGRLLLSGIIDQQEEAVETAVRRAGGQVIDTLTMRDWVTLIVTHKTKTRHPITYDIP